MPDGPLDHILRPVPPWRVVQPLTECGLAGARGELINREEFDARIARYGKARTAFTVCMTCFQTARRWQTWEQDPLRVVARDDNPYAAGQGEVLREELRALAALAEAHRDEFGDLLAGLQNAVRLDDKRRNTRRAAR
jgi:hypothetical protein